MERFANEASALLDGGINNSATSITVKSAVNTPSAGTFRARIDTEYLKVTAVSGSTWTVVRGDGGTTAASHADNAKINVVVTKEAVDSILVAQAAGSEVGNRRIINFVNSASLTWTITDSGANSRIDVTGTAAGSGVSPDRATATAPVSSSFTWQNQGSTTATDNVTGIGLKATAGSGSKLRCMKWTAAVPSAPWEAICRIRGLDFWDGNEFGMFSMQNSNSYMTIVGLKDDKIFSDDLSSGPTGSRSNATNYTLKLHSWVPEWFRIHYDNSASKYYWQASVDGYTWINIRVSFDYTLPYTPDRVGFYVAADNGWGADAIFNCSHFTVGSA